MPHAARPARAANCSSLPLPVRRPVHRPPQRLGGHVGGRRARPAGAGTRASRWPPRSAGPCGRGRPAPDPRRAPAPPCRFRAMAEPTYTPVIALARAVFRGLGLRFTISGDEHVPRAGGAVMAINHVGYLDFTFAGLAARPAGRLVRFMAKKEVFDHKVSGPLMRGMKHIPVDRKGAANEQLPAGGQGAAGRRDRGCLPGGDHLPGVRAQGLQDRRRPDGDGGRRAAAAVRRVGQPARLHQGPPQGPHPRHAASGSWSASRSGRTPPRTRSPSPPTSSSACRCSSTRRGRPTRAAPVRPKDTWWIPASMGGTAPTLEEAAQVARDRDAARAARKAAEGPTT